MKGERRRILFVAEAVTLAHVARPLVLASALDTAGYDVTLACDEAWSWLLPDCRFRVRRVSSISSAVFLRALARGSPVYDAQTLRSYVAADLALIEAVRPDLIVGDFRLSLSVSARLAGIRYVALSNAYWSPYARCHYVVPSLPITRILPIGMAGAVFALVRPIAFALHAQPLNQVRKEFGLHSLGSDLRRTYTDGDFVLYADVPGMFPLSGQPDSHQHLGPIIWSPPIPRPEWWALLPDDRPIVYVTLGSSGKAQILPGILDALAGLPVHVLVATAGAEVGDAPPANAHLADYLPGAEAARRASLVVCNGGSPTCHQALAAGVPVVGIAGNLDQFLNMTAIVDMGAGTMVRADRFDSRTFRRIVQTVLGDPSYAACAARAATSFAQYPAVERFERFLVQWLPFREGASPGGRG